MILNDYLSFQTSPMPENVLDAVSGSSGPIRTRTQANGRARSKHRKFQANSQVFVPATKHYLGCSIFMILFFANLGMFVLEQAWRRRAVAGLDRGATARPRNVLVGPEPFPLQFRLTNQHAPALAPDSPNPSRSGPQPTSAVTCCDCQGMYHGRCQAVPLDRWGCMLRPLAL